MNRFSRLTLRTASAASLLFLLAPAWSIDKTRLVETAKGTNPAPNSIDAVVKDVPECNAPRVGDKSREVIYATESRYGRDPFFLGPRGKVFYSCLVNPKPWQKANLYPDQQAAYWIGALKLPAGAVLSVNGQYPHARYFGVALYRKEGNNIIATNQSLIDEQLVPDAGSKNPYRVGADRLSNQRNFTLRIAAQDTPANQAQVEANTLYAGSAGGTFSYVLRVYLPDVGYDGSGWQRMADPTPGRGLPTYSAKLADGTQLTMEQINNQLIQPMGSSPPGMSVSQWEALIASAPKNDPQLTVATAPARNPARWEKYFSTEYSFVGLFDSPEQRDKIPYAASTGFGGDPGTQYFMSFLSRKFGSVYVFRGKMPTFPNTYNGGKGKGLAVMPDAQLRYWSVILSQAPPIGTGGDALTDMQVPLDANGNYTIVVSRPEDRPTNAIASNGIAWVNWGPGEGLEGPLNRTDFGMILMRFINVNPTWAQSPSKVVVPGTEATVMGPYFPRGTYTDKATFEANGPGIIKSLEPKGTKQ